MNKKIITSLIGTVLIPFLLIICTVVVLLGGSDSETASDGGGSCSITGEIDKDKWDKAFKDAGVLSEYGDTFIRIAEEQGIDPVLFAAISFNETAWGTSSAVTQKNNSGGLMTANGLMSFSTLEEGLECMGLTLHNRIIVDGLTTIEALGSVYCPVGADNDPTGMNINWVPTVTEIAEKLGGLTMNCSAGGGNLSGDPAEYFDVVMKEALKYEGDPYVWGGSSPEVGFDCSGLMQYCFKKAGISLPRTAEEQYYATERIDEKDVQAGDLVFFSGTYAGKYITHVGIVTGKGQMFNSNNGGIQYDRFDSGYWKGQLAGFGRIK